MPPQYQRFRAFSAFQASPFPVQSRAMLNVVCLILENERGEILAVQRPPHKHLGGLWEFPGGKIEQGESPEQALRREILEELYLVLGGGLQPLPPVEYTYDVGTVRLIPFRHTAPRPVIHLAEHTAARWLLPGRLHTLPWMPADLPILDHLAPPPSHRTPSGRGRRG
jgi:8-oxo-dGTP diphosphatase